MQNKIEINPLRSETKKDEIRVFSYNINSDRRVEDNKSPFSPGFKDLSFTNRWQTNKSFLDAVFTEHDDTIFAIQELDDEAKIIVEKYFKEKGLDVYSTKYCLSPGSFNFILALDPKFYTVKKVDQLYYTESGKSTTEEERKFLSKEEKIKRHLGTEFEKSAQILWLEKNNDGKQFVLVNTHPGLEQPLRIASMKKLVEYFDKVNLPSILVGDFNQFNVDLKKDNRPICYDQIDVLLKKGFSWNSEGLLSSGLKATFISFPHDVLRFFNKEDFEQLDQLKKEKDLTPIRPFFLKKIKEKNIPLLSTCLDATFTRGIEKKSVKVSPLTFFYNKVVTTDTIENSKEFESKFLSHFEENLANDMKKPPLGSDHIALSTTIKL